MHPESQMRTSGGGRYRCEKGHLKVAATLMELRLHFGTVKRVAVCAILLVMPIRSALPQAARPLTSFSLAEQPQVRAALDWFAKNLKWINEQQAALTESPAPSFQEEKRSAAVKALFVAERLADQTDKLGKGIAEFRGVKET